jgi:ankyrin repeat protein
MANLLESGSKLDSKDSSGRTPLSYTAENGHEAVVELLLAEDGVDVNSKDKNGQALL